MSKEVDDLKAENAALRGKVGDLERARDENRVKWKVAVNRAELAEAKLASANQDIDATIADFREAEAQLATALAKGWEEGREAAVEAAPWREDAIHAIPNPYGRPGT